MTTGPITATVYIWYPDMEENNIGHASMYIGNYHVGKKFELSLDPKSPDFVQPTMLESHFARGYSRVHFNDNYVSWWAGGEDGAGPLTPTTPSRKLIGLYLDAQAENSEPHTTYELYGLNVGQMRSQWDKDRTKADSHYNLYGKNCSTIVARVLRAGGAERLLGGISGAWHSHSVMWTPYKVAQLCNKLRDKGYAEKKKAGNCPEKDETHFLLRAAGLR